MTIIFSRRWRVEGQFIDYRDLAERHLGTIYEGLLEQHLEAIAPDGTWTVDLFDTAGERHRTGSYYTPDFIVRYMVDQTLGPVLQAAVAEQPDDAATVQAVLAVNCIDPSMGSGHFLVEATEYIARFLVDLALAPGADAHGEADLIYWKRRVAQSCIYGVDLNPLAVDLAKLSLWLTTVAKDRPLSFLDHHLRCGNALVGSLTIEAGRPATSPTKARGKRAVVSDAQLSMLDDAEFTQSMRMAVSSMWQIEGTAGETVAEVKEQERLYADLRATLTRRYAKLADLTTATRFGVAVDPTLWQPLSDFAMGRSLAAPAKFTEWLDAAAQRAEQLRFFHWSLEFPEVFFDQAGQSLGERAGFDMVLGNPPYVRQEVLGPLKAYFQAAYAETYHGVADLYVYFVHQGLRLLQQEGVLAYISSNSWLRANYASTLRAYLRTHTSVEQIIDIGDNRVFADAPDVYPAILITRHTTPAADHSARAATFSRGEGIKNFASLIRTKLAPVTIHDQADSGWQLGADEGRQLFAKLMRAGKPLGEVVGGRMYRGVLTGLNEAFIIDQTTRDRLIAEDALGATIIKPLVNGEDVRPWYVENEGRWLILLPNQWTRANIGGGLSEVDAWQHLQAKNSAITNYLEPFADAARKRSDQGEYWWELRPCNYYADFEKYKIYWPEISNRPRFALADPGIVGNKTTFMIPGNHPYLLGLLMSRATWFTIANIAAPFGERKGVLRYLMSAQYISRLPIPDAPDAEREAIGALAMQITTQAKARYTLHQRTQRRILSDLGGAGAKLNQRLTAWWTLDFQAFSDEVQKVFKRDIPLKDRDDWEEWLDARRAEHQQHTATIVRLETELNARVYALFNLSPAEIALIEASTKYQYGEM